MELVLDLRSGDAGPTDVSDYRRTVRPQQVDVVEGREAGSRAMGFDGRSSRIVVPPAPELSRLGGLRISCRLTVDQVVGRHTIIEGYLAFALFIDADRSMAGTFYDGFEWGGVHTAAAAVPVGQWVDVDFLYDGVDTCTLRIDGELHAAEYNPFGDVPGVQWPYGISVGAWPDADKRVFDGRMEALAMWRSTDGTPVRSTTA
jgi:hypothetical protein